MRIFPRMRAMLALALVIAFFTHPAAADPAKQLRIGYQKTGLLLLLKGQGLLEKRFAAQGIAVSWVEFPSGPPLSVRNLRACTS